ncbi:hypothetical protein DPMN_157644 [Dreissena polymorpha]|uniref:Uncharacterized protein n=1 Tax=Dreissena polymorpha TaxID=45954 RepID=A0A9D4EHK4_DREPO|nr:hypothetical protein DPMN_157644 [Dreissena polymorpha]
MKKTVELFYDSPTYMCVKCISYIHIHLSSNLGDSSTFQILIHLSSNLGDSNSYQILVTPAHIRSWWLQLICPPRFISDQIVIHLRSDLGDSSSYQIVIHLRSDRGDSSSYLRGSSTFMMFVKGTLKTQRFITAVDMMDSTKTEELSRQMWHRNWSRVCLGARGYLHSCFKTEELSRQM